MTALQKNLQYRVHYETQWTHIDFGPEKSLFFVPYTPLQEIVPVLEEHIKRLYPNNDTDYQKGVLQFNRLYRNMIPTYRGWRVAYREPGSDKAFGPINERIGHKTQPRHYTLKPVLQRSMRWINKRYPDIEPVFLGPVPNCGVIVRRLNQQITKIEEKGGNLMGKKNQKLPLSIESSIQTWLSEIDRLQTSGQELKQRAEGKKLDLENDSTWYTFSDSLKQLYESWKRLKRKPTNALVSSSNINDVLHARNQTAKGWHVEFLDQAPADTP